MVKMLETSDEALTNLKIQYLNDRPKSKAFFDRISQVIAGGVNGNLRFYDPFPTTFAKAHGVTLTDLDGHEYIDYLLSYGAMMLGHNHPVIR
jgi:glutamate-1-semialdehyde 2,1-aminomutase